MVGAGRFELPTLCSWSTCGAGLRWSTEAELLDAVGARLDKAIDENMRLIRGEGRLVNASLWVALAAVIAAPVAYWVVPIC